jgi:hypothetical protein
MRAARRSRFVADASLLVLDPTDLTKALCPPATDQLTISGRRSLIQREAPRQPDRLQVPARMQPSVSLGLERNSESSGGSQSR